jgi:hypothetical protein
VIDTKITNTTNAFKSNRRDMVGYLESVPQAVAQSLCRNPLSENFVEIGHFQRSFDKD